MLSQGAEAALFLAQFALDLLIDGEPFGVVFGTNDADLFAGQLREPNQVTLHLFDQLLLSRAGSGHGAIVARERNSDCPSKDGTVI